MQMPTWRNFFWLLSQFTSFLPTAMNYSAKFASKCYLLNVMWCAQKMSAFVTLFGLFEYTIMSFHLCNDPATFQRLMNLGVEGLQVEQFILMMLMVLCLVTHGVTMSSTLGLCLTIWQISARWLDEGKTRCEGPACFAVSKSSFKEGSFEVFLV